MSFKLLLGKGPLMVTNIVELKNELKKFKGEAPYNVPSNHCWGDSYYALSLEIKYGQSIESLIKIAEGETYAGLKK